MPPVTLPHTPALTAFKSAFKAAVDDGVVSPSEVRPLIDSAKAALKSLTNGNQVDAFGQALSAAVAPLTVPTFSTSGGYYGKNDFTREVYAIVEQRKGALQAESIIDAKIP
jgi:hypothetical protein